jgi:hypothetical protein
MTEMEQGGLDSIDTQAILQSVESGQDYNPAPAEAPAQQAPEPQAAPEPKYYEIPWNGQKVRGTEDQLVKWASQGYDYSQKMAEINAKAKEYEQSYGRYREIDDFVKQNPDWWNHVESQWQSRDTFGLDPQLQKVLEPVQSELSTIKSFINEYQQRQMEEQARQDDQRLTEEISSLRSKYPDVDFGSKDENGQSLEYRVIKHANENGITKFTTAFLDYYHDNLQKLYEARGRSAVEQDFQKRKSLGLLGQSQAPTRQQMFESQRPVSYEDAHKLALKELGLE